MVPGSVGMDIRLSRERMGIETPWDRHFIMTNIELIDEFLKLDGDIYRVDSDGSIYSRITRQGHLSSEFRRINRKNHHGYEDVMFRNKNISVHRVIYRKFLGELDKNLVINHINGIKDDNRVENLEQVTQGENNAHRFRILNHPAVIGHSKINQDIADQIRADKVLGLTHNALKVKYDLSKSTISYIVNNKIWIRGRAV